MRAVVTILLALIGATAGWTFIEYVDPRPPPEHPPHFQPWFNPLDYISWNLWFAFVGGMAGFVLALIITQDER